MFLVPQVSVKLEINLLSKILTNLFICL